MVYKEFVDLSYEPSDEDLVCLFYVEPAEGFTMEEAAGRVASESSIGTWTELTTMTKRILEMRARVFEIDGNYVKIAYPTVLFEPGNMPNILSSIAGNVFGMKALNNLRLEDVYWPPAIVDSFKGPSFGIKGVRDFFKVYDRPLTATVPKPKVGFTSDEFAEVAYQIWSGGVDLVKDDENLASQSFNKFKNRVEKVLKAREKAERETGEKKGYLVNVTAETMEMKRRIEFVVENGGEFVMVDIITTGWAAVQTVRELCGDYGLRIHAHRAMHASFTRNPKHGISMKVVAEVARLIGVDHLHIGTVVGKLVSPLEEVLALADILREQKLSEDMSRKVLRKNWRSIKPVLPVSSGGLHPGLIPDVMKLLGKECLLQVGGGVFGHPDGVKSGAAAVRQAISATLEGIPLDEYAKKHKELKRALETWGYMKPK